jgi:Tfp pilus assembly protein PilZ
MSKIYAAVMPYAYQSGLFITNQYYEKIDRAISKHFNSYETYEIAKLVV